VLVHGDVEDDQKLVRALEHRADIIMAASGLPSGYSKEVNGQVHLYTHDTSRPRVHSDLMLCACGSGATAVRVRRLCPATEADALQVARQHRALHVQVITPPLFGDNSWPPLYSPPRSPRWRRRRRREQEQEEREHQLTSLAHPLLPRPCASDEPAVASDFVSTRAEGPGQLFRAPDVFPSPSCV
jgi:hypothetical protein